MDFTDGGIIREMFGGNIDNFTIKKSNNVTVTDKSLLTSKTKHCGGKCTDRRRLKLIQKQSLHPIIIQQEIRETRPKAYTKQEENKNIN